MMEGYENSKIGDRIGKDWIWSQNGQSGEAAPGVIGVRVSSEYSTKVWLKPIAKPKPQFPLEIPGYEHVGTVNTPWVDKPDIVLIVGGVTYTYKKIPKRCETCGHELEDGE